MLRKRHRHLHRHGDKHHRVPQSRGGTNDMRNISRVHPKYHKAFHLLFGNMKAEEIARVLTEVWIDPDKYMVCMPRQKKVVTPKRKRCYCELCNSIVLSYLPRKEG